MNTCLAHTIMGTVLALMITAPANSQAVINFSTSYAQGRSGTIPTLAVWQGNGLTINFIATNERVIKAWLDDPSRLVIDFDTPLSERGDRGTSIGASAIHLRRIEKVKFPHLPSSPSTLLTVITESEQGRNLYYFRLTYGNGQPKYIAANINPDLRPLLQQQKQNQDAIELKASRIERGLSLARQRNNSPKNQVVFDRVETFLAYIRGGTPVSTALTRTNLSPSVIDQLERLGGNP